MAYLLGLPVDAAGEELLVVEVDPSEISDDLVLASPDPGQVVARAEVTLEEALTRLQPSLRRMAQMLKELAPDEAEIEFGLKIGGETGVIVPRAPRRSISSSAWRGRAPETASIAGRHTGWIA